MGKAKASSNSHLQRDSYSSNYQFFFIWSTFLLTFQMFKVLLSLFGIYVWGESYKRRRVLDLIFFSRLKLLGLTLDDQHPVAWESWVITNLCIFVCPIISFNHFQNSLANRPASLLVNVNVKILIWALLSNFFILNSSHHLAIGNLNIWTIDKAASKSFRCQLSSSMKWVLI